MLIFEKKIAQEIVQLKISSHINCKNINYRIDSAIRDMYKNIYPRR